MLHLHGPLEGAEMRKFLILGYIYRGLLSKEAGQKRTHVRSSLICIYSSGLVRMFLRMHEACPMPPYIQRDVVALI